MDRLPNDVTEIKAFDRFSMIHVDRNNDGPRCVCFSGVPLKMFSAGRISPWLLGGRFGGLSDWLRVGCAVDISTGEVGIDYIRN